MPPSKVQIKEMLDKHSRGEISDDSLQSFARVVAESQVATSPQGISERVAANMADAPAFVKQENRNENIYSDETRSRSAEDLKILGNMAIQFMNPRSGTGPEAAEAAAAMAVQSVLSQQPPSAAKNITEFGGYLLGESAFKSFLPFITAQGALGGPALAGISAHKQIQKHPVLAPLEIALAAYAPMDLMRLRKPRARPKTAVSKQEFANIPAQRDFQGQTIADQTGLRYDGFQEGSKNVKGQFQFTDPMTGDTFNATSLTEATRKKQLRRLAREEADIDLEAQKQLEVKVTLEEPGLVQEGHKFGDVREQVPGEAVGLSKAESTKLRRDLKLDDLSEADSRSRLQALDMAKKAGLDKSALELARVLKDNPRPISDVEHAGMVLEATKLADKLDLIVLETNSLIEGGDLAGAALSQGREAGIISLLDDLTEGTRMGRREVARALSIGGMMVNRLDYGLASVVRRAQSTRGRKVTPTERAEFKVLTDKLKAAEKNLVESEALWESERLVLKRKAADATLKREVRVNRVAKNRVSLLEERVDIKRKLVDVGYRLNSGVDTEGLFLIGKLAVNYIREGLNTIPDVVRAIQKDFKGITEREILDGMNTRDPKAVVRASSAVQKRVRALKRQADLMTQVEDAEKGMFRKSKRHFSEELPEISKLKKRLRDLRAQAYKSGASAEKLERTLRTIDDLQSQLSERRRSIKNRFKVDETAELMAMKREIAELRRTIKTEDKLLIAEDQVRRKYRDLKKQREATVDGPELEAMKKRLDLLRREMAVDDTMADLKHQLETGEFKITERRTPKPISPDMERGQVEIRRLKRLIQERIEAERPVAFGKKISETLNTLRTLKATADMSATLRQGALLVPGRPIKSAAAFGKAFKAFFSEFSAEQADIAMRAHPNHYLREKAKLYLPEVGEVKISQREEIFMSNFLRKIPGVSHVVRASERNMVTFLNQIRTAAFDEFLTKYPNATARELNAWADWINVASGRGDLGRMAAAADVLAIGFFAPRFAWSRVQAPYKAVKVLRHKRLRGILAKDMAAFVGTGLTALALAEYAGAEVSFNPRSPDFLKIKIGDTRIDVWGGLQQSTRLMARLALTVGDGIGFSETWGKLAKDEVEDPIELLQNFSAYKASPSFTLWHEYAKQEDMMGHQVDPMSSVLGFDLPVELHPAVRTSLKALVPLVYEDMYDAYEEYGAKGAAAIGGAAFLGVGAQTYEKRTNKVQWRKR